MRLVVRIPIESEFFSEEQITALFTITSDRRVRLNTTTQDLLQGNIFMIWVATSGSNIATQEFTLIVQADEDNEQLPPSFRDVVRNYTFILNEDVSVTYTDNERTFPDTINGDDPITVRVIPTGIRLHTWRIGGYPSILIPHYE